MSLTTPDIDSQCYIIIRFSVRFLGSNDRRSGIAIDCESWWPPRQPEVDHLRGHKVCFLRALWAVLVRYIPALCGGNLTREIFGQGDVRKGPRHSDFDVCFW
jgi:hypothetical protein